MDAGALDVRGRTSGLLREGRGSEKQTDPDD
jgi:hypothetical protein